MLNISQPVASPLSYEVLLLTVAHITLLCCNSLNLATVLPFVTDESFETA